MACGQCAAARKRREMMAKEAASAQNNTKDQIPVVYSKGKRIDRVAENSVCGHMYDELLMLHRKCSDIYKRVRFDGTGEEYNWLQVQREIGVWRNKLGEECPDEEKMDTYRLLINEEYIKLFQKQ